MNATVAAISSDYPCRAFSALSNLQQLHIGIVKHVTGDAFAEGLVRHASLLCHCCRVSQLTSRSRGNTWHVMPASEHSACHMCYFMCPKAASVQPVSGAGMQGSTTGLTDLTLVDCSSLQNRGLVRAALLLLLLHADSHQVPHKLHSTVN
jgi:hypothetical protein